MESAGTRTVFVTIKPEAAVSSEELQALRDLSSTAEILLLGTVRDGKNEEIGRDPVGLRLCYLGSSSQACPSNARVPSATAGSPITAALGIRGRIGEISDGKTTYAIRASDTPLFQGDGPISRNAIAYNPAEPTGPVSLIVIVTNSNAEVEGTIEVTRDLLTGLGPGQYSVEDKLDLIRASALLNETMLESSRMQAVLVFIVAGLMLGLAEFALARSRRKTSGLRRALGASRLQLVAITLCTTAGYGLIGIILGSSISWAFSIATSTALPSERFFLALAVLTQLTVAVASLTPAVYSSTRQPARELRTP